MLLIISIIYNKKLKYI